MRVIVIILQCLWPQGQAGIKMHEIASMMQFFFIRNLFCYAYDFLKNALCVGWWKLIKSCAAALVVL